MPAPSDNPSYNSTRVQRAYRINKVEQSRLHGRLQLLDKEKTHRVRVVNQDIRLTSMTLEYIQSCSGHSVEGRAPDIIPVEKKDDQGPCFLYGERILSRKVRRFQRPQSAFDRAAEQNDSEDSSRASTPVRPQSSPAKRRPTVSWAFPDIENVDASVYSEDGSESVTSDATRSAWEEDTNDVTKRILKAQEGKAGKISLHEKQIRHLRGQRETAKAKTISLHEAMEKENALRRRDSAPAVVARRGSMPNKNASLNEILNQRRSTLSASAWKSHLAQNDSVPVSFEVRSQQIRNEKLKMNNTRQWTIQKKLNHFKEKYPFRD